MIPGTGGAWTRITRRQALGRQAALVSRWEDDLFHFWPGVASSMSGESASIQLTERQLEKPFR